MKHPDYNDSLVARPVEDEVFSDRKAAQIGSEVAPVPPHLRHGGEQLAFLLDEIKPTISRCWIIGCYMDADLDQIQFRLACPENGGHQRRAGCLVRWRIWARMDEISNGATSPRLACSMPRARSRRNSSRCRVRTSSDSRNQRKKSHRSPGESCSVAFFKSVTVLI